MSTGASPAAAATSIALARYASARTQSFLLYTFTNLPDTTDRTADQSALSLDTGVPISTTLSTTPPRGPPRVPRVARSRKARKAILAPRE